jgi:hypothetical protein
MMFTPGRSPSKQARTSDMMSPGRRSWMGQSPARTSLPKITLTPRSTCSSSRGLPRFPSPADDDMCHEALTPMTLFSEKLHHPAPAGTSNSSPITKSFIPMPDWNDAVLAPSTSRDTLQVTLDEADERKAAADSDHGSLSDSDDDNEPFLLAAPGIIIDEKLQASHRQFRQRRWRVPKTTGSAAIAMPPVIRSTDHNASCSSLFGTEFLPSSSELFGMDKSNSSNGNLQLSESMSSLQRGLLKRDESPLGLAIDETNYCGINDSSSGRDLITPPIMLQAHSPPPLSPRQSCMEHRVSTGNLSNLHGYI